MSLINVVSCLLFTFFISPEVVQLALKSYVDKPLFRALYFMESNLFTWKDIPNYEGYYQANQQGQIYSVNAKKVLKSRPQNSGYLLIKLNKNNKSKAFTVHRLIALTFLENPLNKPFVNHKNENKLDNSVDNLEWVTAKENMAHGFNTGLFDNSRKKASERMSLIGKKYSNQNGLRLSKLSYSKVTAESISNSYEFNSLREMQRKLNIDRKMAKKYINKNIPYKGYIIKQFTLPNEQASLL